MLVFNFTGYSYFDNKSFVPFCLGKTEPKTSGLHVQLDSTTSQNTQQPAELAMLRQSSASSCEFDVLAQARHDTQTLSLVHIYIVILLLLAIWVFLVFSIQQLIKNSTT